jgi:hypothetical protein
MLFVCCMLCSILPAEFQLLTEVSSKYAMLTRLATMLHLSFCVILVCLDLGAMKPQAVYLCLHRTNKMSFDYPDHSDIDPEDPAASFKSSA